MEKDGVVAMRLFANWDMDRASSQAVPRVFTVSINRLVFNNVPATVHSLVITAKLEGHKRSLRSNEINVTVNGGRLDMDLDISFTIQYPHFVKCKRNVLKLIIQRKRKYKNRPIPGGFKTLAIGAVDLTSLLQQGGLREIMLWANDMIDKERNTKHVQSVGRLELGTCQTSALELDIDRQKRDKTGTEADFSEEDSSSDFDDVPVDSDVNELPSARTTGRRHHVHDMNRKMVRRKNLKQKFVNLLRKFNRPEDGDGSLVASTCASVVGAPTAKELEALFEELEEMSDSGPEVGGDDVSIGSNPRPALRPFFTRSREILPAIYDHRDVDVCSDSEAEDALESSPSDENQQQKETREEAVNPVNLDAIAFEHEKESTSSTLNQTPSKQQRVSSTTSAPLGTIYPSISSQGVPHSMTIGSISGARKATKGSVVGSIASGTESGTRSISDQLCALLGENSAACTTTQRWSIVWLCDGESPIGSVETFGGHPSTWVRCLVPAHVKQAISHVTVAIQNFCNSNSVDPPMIWVGVLGGDRLISQVLRAYVDCLHHKSSSPCLQFLRFALVSQPNSLVARLLDGMDPTLDQLCRDVWDRWNDLNGCERSAIVERLENWPQHGACLNLPIGEALLQMADTKTTESESGSMFVPFLSEVRVGQSVTDEDTESPRGEDRVSGIREQRSGTFAYDLPSKERSAGTRERTTTYAYDIPQKDSPSALGSSPPNSPATRGDTCEMNVEYWLQKDANNHENVNFSASGNLSTPNARKDTTKGSLKTSFRTLVINRLCVNPLLSLSFVKEKRKDKMLHKLGMKKGQRSEMDGAPVQIGNISRLLCSASGKHNDLKVLVDGTQYHGIRYFQTSSQWQTHIKTFPVTLLSAVSALQQ